VAKKLVLINPVNSRRTGLVMSADSRFSPLGLGIVAALTPDDWAIEILDENLKRFEFKEADLVGLTAFTSAAPRAYEIARLYRDRGIPTVLGGIHASMLPEEALQHVDTVVIGEAEGVWPGVISDYEAGKMQRVYRGEWPDLNKMPHPRRDLFHRGYVLASIQTARGCPMDCDFCSVTAFNGRRYRQRPVSDVLDELESIPQKKVFFVDDNIVGYGKRSAERAVALFKGIIARGIRKHWFCQASINFADDEDVLEYAAKSGCKMVLLGVEAENPEALEELNKKMNMRAATDTYEGVFRRIHRHGIAVLGAFIYGMDSDTPEALRRRTDYILASGADAVQTTYLTPLPGTKLFRKLHDEERLIYADFPQDWEHYDFSKVTYQPLSIERRQLADALYEGVRRIYGLPTIWRRFARTWRATRSLLTALWAYSANIAYRNAVGGAIALALKKRNDNPD